MFDVVLVEHQLQIFGFDVQELAVVIHGKSIALQGSFDAQVVHLAQPGAEVLLTFSFLVDVDNHVSHRTLGNV